MTPLVRTGVFGVALGVTAAIALLVLSMGASAQTGSDLPYRLFVPGTARDGVLTPGGGNVPPPDPSYCPGNGPLTQPNSVFGLLTIGGQQAPVGTLVQISFDGKTGPGIRTVETGGYRVDYTPGGGGSCANQNGANISILVNGQAFPANVKVGDGVAVPFLRFDIAVP